MSLLQRLRSLDSGIVILTTLLLVFGLVMLMSSTAAVSVQRAGDPFFYLKRQLLSGVLPGAILFGFFAFVDYRSWKKVSIFAFIGSILLLALVYVPGIGQMRGGARSWVEIGPIGFQPSELVKLTFLIYVSAWLAAREGKRAHSLEEGLVPFLAALGSVMLLLVLQPDTGSMSVIVAMALAVYFVSGAPIGWFVGLSGAGAGLLWFLIKTSPYRAARFMTFLHPELDPQGKGYHINQALLAIGSGGIWGVGYGQSRQKFLYLPEVESDSIVAVMAEELGLIGIVVFLALYLALVWRCLKIAKESEDRFGMYLAIGIASLLMAQLILNVGSMAGLIPMTGVTLPFFSHGGSAMTVLLGAMGLVAGIPRAYRRSSR